MDLASVSAAWHCLPQWRIPCKHYTAQPVQECTVTEIWLGISHLTRMDAIYTLGTYSASWCFFFSSSIVVNSPWTLCSIVLTMPCKPEVHFTTQTLQSISKWEGSSKEITFQPRCQQPETFKKVSVLPFFAFQVCIRYMQQYWWFLQSKLSC